LVADPFNTAALHRIAADHARVTLAKHADLFACDEVPDARAEEVAALAEVWGLRAYVEEDQTSLRNRLRDHLAGVLDGAAPPPPTPAEKVAIKAAKKRTRRRNVPPAIAVKKVGRKRELVSPHSDTDGWVRQLCDALATRSLPVLHAFISSLQALQPDHRDPDAVMLNAAIAIISDAKPKTTGQAMLVAQLVALNWLFMDASARALNSGSGIYMANAARLARAFNDTMAQLHRQQGKGSKFTLNVRTRHDHRHTHLHVEGGGSDFGGQSDEPRGRGRSSRAPEGLPPGEPARLLALPSPNPAGDALSVPGDAEPAALPPPRRQGRRAEG
jgi:hypothetical protein